jgi:hypothetical protein
MDAISQCRMAAKCAEQYIVKWPDKERVTAKFTEDNFRVNCILYNDAQSIMVFGTKK